MLINIIADMKIKCLLPFFNKGAYRLLTGSILIPSVFYSSCEKSARDNPSISKENKVEAAALYVLRANGPKLVNKLLASDSYNESARLEPLKSKVSNLVAGYKTQNAISSASVG